MMNDILEKETLNILPIEVIKFYFDLGQVRLNDYRDKETQTTERGYKLITLYIGIITALMSYIYVNWDISNKAIIPLFALLLSTICAASIILMIILPRLYMPKGRKPSEYKANEIAKALKCVSNDTDKYKCILSKELNVLEEQIYKQSKFNEKRTRLFKISFYIEIIGVAISFLLFILILAL